MTDEEARAYYLARQFRTKTLAGFAPVSAAQTDEQPFPLVSNERRRHLDRAMVIVRRWRERMRPCSPV